jgi:tryptophan-rich sensory protein
VDASLNQQLTLAAVGMSGAALFFSLLAAFPGLKSVLAAVRDGVLWFALFLVLGASGFMVWQSAQESQPAGSAGKSSPGIPTAEPAPQNRP